MARKKRSTRNSSPHHNSPTPATPPTPAAASTGKPAAKASSGGGKAGASGKPKVEGDGHAPPRAVMTLSHDEIARKAYDIWVAKGRPLGQDARNWAEAEAALREVSA